jgi:hypothetical protein
MIKKRRNRRDYMVRMSDKEGKTLRYFGNCTEAGRVTGVDRRGISACCQKTQSTAGGFKWDYEKIAKD